MEKNYKYDSEIADLVLEIMGNGTMEVETFNESLLVKYFQLRGTPLTHRKTNRDIDKDYAIFLEENK